MCGRNFQKRKQSNANFVPNTTVWYTRLNVPLDTV